MSNAVSKQIGQTVHLKANFTNPDGSPGNVVGVPTWSSDNLAVFDPNAAPGVISADGLTVDAPVLGVGVANVVVSGEGDPVAGVDTVKLPAIVTGLQQEISGGSVEAS